MGNKILDMYKKSSKIEVYKDNNQQDTNTKTKQTTKTQESMFLPTILEAPKSSMELVPTKVDAIDSLKRHFGTDDEYRITTVGAESFMGSEPAKKENSNS